MIQLYSDDISKVIKKPDINTLYTKNKPTISKDKYDKALYTYLTDIWKANIVLSFLSEE